MAITKDSISVVWDGYQPDAIGNSPILGFRLCISSDNRNFNCIDLGQEVRTHTFTSLNPNTTYYLTLQGFNAIGESEPVKLVGTTLDNITEVPNVPTVEVRQSDENEAYITTTVQDWETSEVSSIEVQRSEDSRTWAALATVTNIDKAEYTHFDDNLTTGSTYYYRSRATNRVGNSAWSQVVSIEIEDCDNRCGVVSDVPVRFEQATPAQKRAGSFILAPEDQDFCGPYRECPPEPVSKPRNLAISNITHESADASWDSPLQTGGYEILKYILNLDGGADIEVSATDAALESLLATTTYTLEVRAVNNLGTVSLPASVDFTTLAVPPPPPKAKPNAPNVDGVMANEQDKAVITFDQSADRANKPVERYMIYERLADSDVLLRTISADSVAAEYDVSTLASQTKTYTAAGTYRFFMRAANSDAESDNSNIVHFTVDEPEPMVPLAPTFDSLERDDDGNVTVEFSYSSAGPAANSFRVYEDLATDVVRGTFEAEDFLPGQNSRTLRKRLSRTYTAPGTYRYYIKAVNADGESDSSATLSFTIEAVVPDRRPSSPTNLQIATHNATNDKTFSWVAPTDAGKPPFENYTIFLTPVGGSIAELHTTSATTLRVQNLLYNTTYEVVVRASNSAGSSDSNRLRFTTGGGRPTPPRNLRLELVDEVNVRARWDAPTSPNGTINEYRLYLRELLRNAQWIRIDVGNVLNWLVTNLERGKTFEFEATAVNDVGESIFTNNPVNITIPDFEKPGAVELLCDLQGEDFVLFFFPPILTGGSPLYRYRLAITVPGQAGSRNLDLDYPQVGAVVVQEQIKTLFGISTLPSGTYSFEARIRNEELDEYSDTIASSRCTINYTQPVSRPKAVTNIQFTKPSDVLVVTFDEPTDTGVYQFDVSVEVRGNTSGSYQADQLRLREQTPDGQTQTFTTEIMGDVFDDTTITATIVVSKVGTLETTTTTRTQVYEDVVAIANAPVVNNIQRYSDNVPRISFNYPIGHEPITSFRVYEVVGGVNTLRQTITNDKVPAQTNIIEKVGSATYTAAGTYTFYMTSVNSAGESVASNRVSFTVAPPPPPPPPRINHPPRLISVRRTPNSSNGLIFNWDWPPGGSSRYRTIRFIEDEGNPGFNVGTPNSMFVDVDNERRRRNIQTTIPMANRARELAGTYKFSAQSSTQPHNSFDSRGATSGISNTVQFTLNAPPPTVPGSPNLRRVDIGANNRRITYVFDFPTTGGLPDSFDFIMRRGSEIGIILTNRLAVYMYRGQTSILVTTTRRQALTAGRYYFKVRGRIGGRSSGIGYSSNEIERVIVAVD